MKILSHLLLSENIWLQRLKSEKYDNKFWTELTFEDCRELSEENKLNINTYLNSLSETDFNNVVKYTNSKGIEYTNTIVEILTHLSHHSAYHRGQIAKEMRRLGERTGLYRLYSLFKEIKIQMLHITEKSDYKITKENRSIQFYRKHRDFYHRFIHFEKQEH